jgi:hypothetical protein
MGELDLEKLIDQFEVVTGKGQQVRLYVYQEVTPAGSFGDPHATIPGLKRIEDEEGNGVNYIDDVTYELVASGEIGTRTKT